MSAHKARELVRELIEEQGYHCEECDKECNAIKDLLSPVLEELNKCPTSFSEGTK